MAEKGKKVSLVGVICPRCGTMSVVKSKELGGYCLVCGTPVKLPKSKKSGSKAGSS